MISASALLTALTASTLFQEPGPKPVSLPPAAVTLDADFTGIAQVRSLADGRILITDRADKKLLVGDWTKRTATQIGREGRGPNEYVAVGSLLPIGGDSTILPDPQGGRWLLLKGAQLVGQTTGDAPVLKNGARNPLSADGAGRVLATVNARPADPNEPPPSGLRADSVRLVRFSRATGVGETLAVLAGAQRRIDVNMTNGKVSMVRVSLTPFAAGDGYLAFADGGVAIVRVAPYRVDWVLADGRKTTGTPLPFTRIAVDDREKRAYLALQAERTGRPAASPETIPDWPATIPPFQSLSLFAAPDGRIWIQRNRTASNPETRYDVVDRRGVLVARVTMSGKEQVVGFGPAAVFSVLTDDDGLQHLRRHPFPKL